MRTAGVPDADDVAAYYDVMGPLLQLVWGDNFHFGYWDDDQDTSDLAEATDRLTRVVAERLAPRPGDRVLDLGCGVGVPALRLAALTGATVLGISYNRRQVDEASDRARAAGAQGRVRFAYADAMALPYPDASFDAVFALESFVHLDRPRALRECVRVLRPGGRIVLTDMLLRGEIAPELRSGVEHGLAVQRLAPFPTADYYRDLADEEGLVVEELTDLSDHTRLTVHRIADSVTRHRREIEERYGDQARAIAAAMRSPLQLMPEFGYQLLLARRPFATGPSAV
ncbi:methyltransferase domain-containing protein [Streptomyces sp. NPDC000594]|uniref:SAM-dependent methyltransferase n=1 Tax=Streptomyces sp. NPDC000594 TaxID=3154261 RepID=UPI0033194E6F